MSLPFFPESDLLKQQSIHRFAQICIIAVTIFLFFYIGNNYYEKPWQDCLGSTFWASNLENARKVCGSNASEYWGIQLPGYQVALLMVVAIYVSLIMLYRIFLFVVFGDKWKIINETSL